MDSTTSTKAEGIKISKRSFAIAIAVIFALMAATYILTLVVPGGEYARVINSEGNTVVDTSAGFRYVDGGLPFWKWLLSPFLSLTAEGSGALIAVLVFLVVIGGVFNALYACGIMNYMLSRIVDRFGSVKYRLMAALIFFFMAMGSLIGSFEEVIPMAPIIVSLAVALGWDRVTGVAMSLLAVGCGFAAGIANPFSIGVAQGLAGIPMFSGAWLRVLSFALIYPLLLWFIRRHAKKVEKPADSSAVGEMVRDPRKDRAVLVFGVILGIGMVIVLSSAFIPALQDLTMIIVALMFLVAGVSSVLISGISLKELAGFFLKGVVSISPSILMILMASSIKYTMVEGKILDTVLHYAEITAGSMPKWGMILFIYGICLVMNFFIASGSAKAFLLIPIIAPLAQMFGLSMNLAIVAFAFGDGFSNVIYPTNAGLLITLGLSDVGYGEWVRYSLKFQLLNLLLTSGILMFGLAAGY